MAENSGETAVKNTETRDSIKQSISDAYEELQKAIQKDKSLNEVVKKKTGKPGNLSSNKIAWAKKYWYYILFIIMAVALVVRLMDPKPYRSRSHHKWDKNGKLIY